MTSKEWLEILLQLVKESGSLAIWGLLVFQLLEVIKASVGWIFVLWSVKIVTGTIVGVLKWAIERDVVKLGGLPK